MFFSILRAGEEFSLFYLSSLFLAYDPGVCFSPILAILCDWMWRLFSGSPFFSFVRANCRSINFCVCFFVFGVSCWVWWVRSRMVGHFQDRRHWVKYDASSVYCSYQYFYDRVLFFILTIVAQIWPIPPIYYWVRVCTCEDTCWARASAWEPISFARWMEFWSRLCSIYQKHRGS